MDELFTPRELTLAVLQLKKAGRGLLCVPLRAGKLVLMGLLLSLLLVLEFELLYRVFEYLAGTEGKYWSPVLMGLIGMVIILAFHLLADIRPNNVAARVVNALAERLIPIYLIGIGILVAAIVFASGLGEMLESDAPLILGQLPEQAVQHGIVETIFQYVANPAAVLAFSVGLGGLAIINVFTANHLVKRIGAGLKELSEAFQRFRDARTNHAEITNAQREFAQACADERDLELRDRAFFAELLAAETVDCIDRALQPHRLYAQNQAFSPITDRFLEHGEDPDPKIVAKAIEAIENITFERVKSQLLK